MVCFAKYIVKPSSNALPAGCTKHNMPLVPSWFETQSTMLIDLSLPQVQLIGVVNQLSKEVGDPRWTSCTPLAGCEAQWQEVLEAAREFEANPLCSVDDNDTMR